MDFEVTDEQRLIRETARAFADGTSQIQKLIIGRALTGINALVPS